MNNQNMKSKKRRRAGYATLRRQGEKEFVEDFHGNA
jgi:hypothetical protein